MRDSDLDFGVLGDAMNRAQVTPWQAHIIFDAFTKVMAGKTITPELVNVTERKLRAEMYRSGKRALSSLEGQAIHSAYFDGKRNLVMDVEDGRQTTKKNDNISIVLYGDELAKGKYAGMPCQTTGQERACLRP